MAFDHDALLLVLAAEHADPDQWVYEEARAAYRANPTVRPTSETYRGVWLTPWPESTHVHVFSRAGRNRLISFGLTYLRGWPDGSGELS